MLQSSSQRMNDERDMNHGPMGNVGVEQLIFSVTNSKQTKKPRPKYAKK